MFTSTFRVATNKFTVDTSGNTLAAGTLSVSGATTMDSTLNVGSDFKVATDKFSVTALNGNTAVGGVPSESRARRRSFGHPGCHANIPCGHLHVHC